MEIPRGTRSLVVSLSAGKRVPGSVGSDRYLDAVRVHLVDTFELIDGDSASRAGSYRPPETSHGNRPVGTGPTYVRQENRANSETITRAVSLPMIPHCFD